MRSRKEKRTMLSVGVFVDLQWCPEAGGHVKCWEQLASAVEPDHDLDLTIHFLGDGETCVSISENVRFQCHVPQWGSDRFPFLKDIAAHTDLAFSHPQVWQGLSRYDILHTTHPLFALSQTAWQFAQRFEKPLVTSIHTDLPKYTRIFTTQVIRHGLKPAQFSQFLIDQCQLPHSVARLMDWRLRQYYRRCRHVIASQPEDYQALRELLPESQRSLLRRGIDTVKFHPAKRDRAWLASQYNIDPAVPWLLYVGRLSPEKGVMTLAQAVVRLREQGYPLQILLIGDGPHREAIQTLLGEIAILPGFIAPDDLPIFYSSADLFVFPSQTETYGNVVLEAKASGLPILVSTQGGAVQSLQGNSIDGYAIDRDDGEAWATAIAMMLEHPQKCQAMGQAARHHIETQYLSWRDVLEQDLLPVWRKYS